MDDSCSSSIMVSSQYSSSCDLISQAKCCSVCFNSEHAIMELPCSCSKSLCTRCLHRMIEESGDSSLHCWSCGTIHKLRDIAILNNGSDQFILEENKENVVSTAPTVTLVSVAVEKVDEEREQLESMTRQLETVLSQLTKENEQLTEALNSKETEIFSLNEQLCTNRNSIAEVKYMVSMKASEYDTDRRAWVEERQQLHKKIEEISYFQKVVDNLKHQLVGKDNEIRTLKDSLQSTKPAPAIGVDIGTTNCCVAFAEDGRVESIHDQRNDAVIRSTVRISTDILSDQDPIQIGADETSTAVLTLVKRLLCLSYEATKSQVEKQKVAFEVAPRVEEADEQVFLRVPSCSGEKFSTVELYAIILNKLKMNATTHFKGRTVLDAVIAVPANFTDFQRQTVIDAAGIVGLNVLRLINETTAVFHAYVSRVGENIPAKSVLIVSVGGGMTEAAYWQRDELGRFLTVDCRAISYGGEDIDSDLVKHCLEVWKEQMPDFQFDKEFFSLLKEKCRKVKEELSTGIKATELRLKMKNGTYFSLVLSKKDLVDLICKHYLPMFRQLIERVVRKRSSPEEIILSGGSLRIPLLINELQEEFPAARICKSVNYGEAVAQGAAVQAAYLSGRTQVPAPFKAFPSFAAMDFDCFLIDNRNKCKIAHCWRMASSFPLPHEGKFFHSLPERIKADPNLCSPFSIKLNINKVPFGIAELKDGKLDDLKFSFKVDKHGIVIQFYVSYASRGDSVVHFEKYQDGLSKKEARRIAANLDRYREEIENRSKQRELCNKVDTLIAYAEGVSIGNSDNSRELQQKCQEWLKWFDGNSLVASYEELFGKYREIEQYLRQSGVEPPSLDA